MRAKQVIWMWLKIGIKKQSYVRGEFYSLVDRQKIEYPLREQAGSTLPLPPGAGGNMTETVR